MTLFDTIVQMYVHSLMVKYSLVERHMVIPYNTIEGKYCSEREFILYVTFLVLFYLNNYSEES